MKPSKSSTRFFILMMAVVFTALAVGGCGGGSGGNGSSSDGGSVDSPNIALSTDQLLFGNVVANAGGERSADHSVQVTNTGTANLVIGQIALANPLASPFSIFEDHCSGVSLAPNASCTVDVRFAPRTPGTFSDSFDLPSNDADQPSRTVSVSGNGKGLNVTINKVDTSGVSGTGGPVKVLVSVTNGINEPVTTLLEGDFHVFENGGGPQAITNFSNTVTTPVSAALDLDYSTSIAPVQSAVEDAAKGFLDDLNPLTDEAAVFKFGETVVKAIDFTPLTPAANLQAVKDAIDDVSNRPSSHGTQLYDAVLDSVTAFSPPGDDRHVAIVVTDGVNNPGPFDRGGTLDSVILDAQGNKVFIYTIGLAGDVGINREALQRMAVETGGQYFEAPSPADLSTMYTQISQILTNQYEITFVTTQPHLSSNSLNVVVGNPPLDGEDTKVVTY